MLNKLAIGAVLCSLVAFACETDAQATYGGRHRPHPPYPHPRPYYPHYRPPYPYPYPYPYPNNYPYPYPYPPYNSNRGRPHRVFSVDGIAEEIDHVDAVVDSDLDAALSEEEFKDVIIIPSNDRTRNLIILSPTELLGADKLIYNGEDDEKHEKEDEEEEEEEVTVVAVDEDGDGRPDYYVRVDE